MTLLVQTMAMNIARFWGWWLYELGLLAPSWLRDFFYTPRTYLFIRIKNFQVFFSYVDKDSEKELLHVYMHKEGQLQQDAFFKTHPEWMHATKILLLNPKQLLKKRLDLPLAAQNNLLQVLGYELDRYTPFNNDQCYFSTQILDKNKASNRLVLELIFISKQKLHHYYNELQNLGLKIDIISHEDDRQQYQANAYSQQYNLLPKNLQDNQGQDFKGAKHFLTACLLLLIAIAAALPFWFQQQTLDDLQQQVAMAKHKALEIEEIKAETTALLHVEKKLAEIKQQAPVILNVVEQLSTLLPKDTWLKSFEYKDNKFLLQGLSASSSALIGLLETSPYFKQTTMVSPVTRDNKDEFDQFELETYRESPHDAG